MDFTNQATLTYNNKTITSNTVTETLIPAFTLTKESIQTTYSTGDNIVYTITATNNLNTQVSPVYIFDDLGVYDYNGVPRIPSEFDMFSTQLQIISAAGVSTSVVGVNVENNGVGFMFIFPANSTAIISYSAKINSYADISSGASIKSNVTLDTASYDSVLTTHTIDAANFSDIQITKLPSANTVSVGKQMSYTFLISNYGNTASSPTISDIVNPYLTNVTVYGDSTLWTEGTEYTYEIETGLLNVMDGVINIPPATTSVGPLGSTEIFPSSYEVVISGTVSDTLAPEPYINLLPIYTDLRQRQVTITRDSNLEFTIHSALTTDTIIEIVTNLDSTITPITTPNITFNNNIMTIAKAITVPSSINAFRVSYRIQSFIVKVNII